MPVRVSKRKQVFCMVFGVFIGIFCHFSCQSFQTERCCRRAHGLGHGKRLVIKDEPAPRKQVLIGVMTADSLIDSRVIAIWRTWAQTINGDVLFFSSASTKPRNHAPIINLPGVDDSYPPTKKAFMMVKFMHDFGIDKYNFFMRVDDDAYIHGRRLSEFLSRLNSSDLLYIGQPGFGRERDDLSLTKAFCLGGSATILSADTLRRVGPNLDRCLQNLISLHDDAELGRCVTKFAAISCTGSYQMSDLFYHSYNYLTDQNSFPNVLTGTEMDSAVTFHPLKGKFHQYSVHNVIMANEKSQLELRILHKREEIEQLDRFLSDDATKSRSQVMTRSDRSIVTWNFLTEKQRVIHNTFGLKYAMETPWKHSLGKVLSSLRKTTPLVIKGNTTVEEQAVKSLIYGFSRAHPLAGLYYLLSSSMEYRREKMYPWRKPENKLFPVAVPFLAPMLREVTKPTLESLVIIVPLSGRVQQFQRFIRNFEKVCLVEENNCRLIVVLSKNEVAKQVMDTVRGSPAVDRITIESEERKFARSVALHLGVTSLPQKDALMFFLDVDVHFTAASLQRVRLHTTAGKQAYFPVVFSQYNNHIVCDNQICPIQDREENAGNYRFHGFGIASLYKTDYVASGGFNLTITGWGKEDVDLFEKVMSHLTIFRAADPDLVHIYHPITCESDLSVDQSKMCNNSKASTIGSQESLAQLYFRDQLKKAI